MRTGRPKQPLTVDASDREKLTLPARRPKTAQRAAIRAKIVLRTAEGLSNQEIARQLGITGSTVGKWRERYRQRGMKGLADDSRPGTPRTITDAMVEAAVTRTEESPAYFPRHTSSIGDALLSWEAALYAADIHEICLRQN